MKRHEHLLELSGVKKSFGRAVALDGLNLAIDSCELVAVLGPNGAGKSTAISLMLGLHEPDSGSVKLFARSPRDLKARLQIGVMMQEVFLAPELRVCEQIDLVASYYSDPLTPDAAMEMTQTSSLATRPYGTLSGGQKRQVQLAMAVCGRPRLLFLDEPSVGLDLRARQTMWSTLRGLVSDGASILLTTHYLEEAEALADRVVVLAKGRVIAAGTVNEMRALVMRQRISCRSSVNVETVKGWPYIETVSRDLDHLFITTADAQAVVLRLFAADPNLTELDVRRAGLAEVFSQLTLTEEDQ